MLITEDQKWDRLRALAEQDNQDAGFNFVLYCMTRVERELKDDLAEQQARFDSYIPDIPHDSKCNSWLDRDCNCSTESHKRDRQIRNAGFANDLAFRETLTGFDIVKFDTYADFRNKGWL